MTGIGKGSRWLASCVWLVCGLASADAAGCDGAKTQFDLDKCTGDAFKAADAALNLTYTNIMTRLRGQDDTRKLLVTAQKAWLSFRIAECDFEASGALGGSIYPMVKSGCAARLTRARTEELRRMLTCAEGDAGCPVPPK